MDRASVEALHEKASQHYLNGEFAQALAAWESLLRLDPADERALEGTRLSRMMVGPEELAVLAPQSADEAPLFEIDHELLGVAAGRASAAPASRPAALPDPIRQSEGIDFGDVASVPPLPLAGSGEDDAIDAALATLGTAPPADLDAPDAPDAGPQGVPTLGDLLAMELDPGPAPAEALEVDESALAPFQTPAPAPAPAPPAPAEGELSRRLSELLAQASTAADAGDNEEAKALLARIAVLDEDNAVAAALADRLREAENQGLRQIDDWIVEGVQWFEQGRLVEARGNFARVLEAMPDHIEAQDYLRRIEEVEASRHAPPSPAAPQGQGPHVDEDFLASLTDPSPPPPAIEAVPLAAPSPRSRPPAAAVAAPVADPAARSRKRLSPLVLVVVLSAAAAAGWFFFGPEESRSDIPVSALALPTPAGSAGTRPSPPPAAPASAPQAAEAAPAAAPAPTSDPHARVAAATAKGDWPAAILAYNEILAAHPDDAQARAGLLQAGERYRDRKAIETQVLQARRAFEDGEFEAGLRLLYRMPGSVDARILEGGKVAGWVNLGIVELKAGNPGQAITQLDEALALRADDAEARSLRAFAQEYSAKARDGGYYARVEAMEFRPLPD